MNYDVGMRASADWDSRPVFDPAVVRREMEIIKGDLGCAAVRIFGEDPDRLRIAAESALEAGLRVWFSPDLFNAGERQWLEYLARCADVARGLDSPDVVFVVGRELTFFMHGLVRGADGFARMKTFSSISRLLLNTALKGPWNRNLNRFLAKATAVVRERFDGPVTYASGVWEQVDWSGFDFVAVDLYRDAPNEAAFADKVCPYLGHGKPMVVSEFGCCTYRGAAGKGATGWAIVDREAVPPALKGEYVRDEAEQAAYLTESMDVYAAQGVESAFVFTFASYSYPHDLDLAAYGIVRVLREGTGETYPDLPWEPKEAFHAVAAWSATATA